MVDRNGRNTRPAAEKDRQIKPRTCDICGPLPFGETPVHLSGPAGDVALCESCIRLLAEKAA